MESGPNGYFSVCYLLQRSSSGRDAVVDVCEQCMALDSGDSFYYGSSRRFWDLQYLRSHDCGLTLPLRTIAEHNIEPKGVFRYIAYHKPCLDNHCGAGNAGNRIMHFRKSKNEAGVGMVRSARTFASTPGSGITPTQLAHALDRVDFRQIKIWLDACPSQHSLCSLRRTAIVPGFRLINCDSKEICLATPDQAYIALSYVWGSSSTDDMAVADRTANCFPNTIEDALLVAKEIGIPYLWVDRYCIDQDDQEQKHTMISSMDKIYSEAALTVVASGGASPHHGLPGVSGPRRAAWRMTLNSGFLEYFEDASLEVSGGPWSKRGWTYQEMLLSRRRLIFTDSQMMYQCCSLLLLDSFSLGPVDAALAGESNASVALSASELGCPSDAWGWISDGSPQTVQGLDSEDIYTLINEFSARQLSYPEDRLNAMEGVFSAFRNEIKGYAHHFWGIPLITHWYGKDIDVTSSFCIGLQWRFSRPSSLLDNMPSWSWAAWNCKVQFYWKLPPVLQYLHEAIKINIVRPGGYRESLEDFALGQRNYEEYEPWVEITTWVGTYDHLLYGDIELDSKRRYWRTGDMAVYIGTRYERGEHFKFLVVERTNDGSFRRIGLAKQKRSNKVVYLSGGEIRKWEDTIRQQRLSVEDFAKGWEHKTIRLV
ncbi:HET-domain-containing protein [Phaeosphaeriaceae sp. SRC1lsM3a]|nr:HET-domain-containing protein [Stagonospora sp. SRC1lsM3a]